MNLFELLSNDERIIVLSDKATRTIYTWNQDLTLQAWEPWRIPDQWVALETRTLFAKPRNFEEARKAALVWWGPVTECQFLSGRGALSKEVIAAATKIAKENGARFVYQRESTTGYIYWFAGPDAGPQFNRQREKGTYSQLVSAGLVAVKAPFRLSRL